MPCYILFSLSHAYSCIALTNGKQVLQFQLELYSYKCMSVYICMYMCMCTYVSMWSTKQVCKISVLAKKSTTITPSFPSALSFSLRREFPVFIPICFLGYQFLRPRIFVDTSHKLQAVFLYFDLIVTTWQLEGSIASCPSLKFSAREGGVFERDRERCFRSLAKEFAL